MFLYNKMEISTNEVLRYIINFSMMKMKYIVLCDAVRKGDSMIVEAMYKYVTPIQLALGGQLIFNIALDQIDKLDIKTLYHISICEGEPVFAAV